MSGYGDWPGFEDTVCRVSGWYPPDPAWPNPRLGSPESVTVWLPGGDPPRRLVGATRVASPHLASCHAAGAMGWKGGEATGTEANTLAINRLSVIENAKSTIITLWDLPPNFAEQPTTMWRKKSDRYEKRIFFRRVTHPLDDLIQSSPPSLLD